MLKAAIGVSVAALLVAGVLYSKNQKLIEQRATLQTTVDELTNSVEDLNDIMDVHKETALIATQALADMQREQAKNARTAEAILSGDTEALNDLEGSVGDALRLLSTFQCGEPEQ